MGHLWSVLPEFKVAFNNVFQNLFSIYRICSISIEMLIRGVSVMMVILRSYIHNLSNRLFSSENEIIKNMVKSDILSKSMLSLKWNNMLYRIISCI